MPTNEIAIKGGQLDKPKFDIEFATERILKFCEITSGVNLYDYQREFGHRVIESVIANDGSEITALFSRQSGKTETIAIIIVGLAILLPVLAEEFVELEEYKDGIWIGLFAPVHEQVNTTYMRAMDRIKSEHAEMILSDPEIAVSSEKERSLELSNGSFLKGMSGAKQTMIESKSFHFVIVEEAQDMDSQKVRKSIHPMLSAYNGTMVKIGTPNNKKSDFWSAIRRNKSEHLKGGAKNHFEYNCDRVIKDKRKRFKETSRNFHPKYEMYIKQEKKRIGADSDEFLMSYMLKFIMERGMFLTDDAFEGMLDKSLNLKEQYDGPVVIGIDIGKSDASTVMTVMGVDLENPDEETGGCKKWVVNWYEIQDDNYETQFFRITEVIDKFDTLRVVIDATGVGEVMSDRIMFHYSQEIMVDPYKFSTVSKSLLFKYLDTEIKTGRVIVPYSARSRRTTKFKRFKNQILQMEKEWKGAHMDCHKPNEKWAYDDYVDSLALSVWAAKDEVLADVEQQKLRVIGGKKRGTAYW